MVIDGAKAVGPAALTESSCLAVPLREEITGLSDRPLLAVLSRVRASEDRYAIALGGRPTLVIFREGQGTRIFSRAMPLVV